MVCPSLRPTLSHQELHRQPGPLIRRCIEPFQKPTQHPLQSKLHFSANRQILVEHNMEIIHQRYLFRLRQGHEHLSEQLLDIENLKWRNLRLFQKPNDPKTNQLTKVTNELRFHHNLPAMQIHPRKRTSSKTIISQLLPRDTKRIPQLDSNVLHHLYWLDRQASTNVS